MRDRRAGRGRIHGPSFGLGPGLSPADSRRRLVNAVDTVWPDRRKGGQCSAGALKGGDGGVTHPLAG